MPDGGNPLEPSEGATPEQCYFCFEVLTQKLENGGRGLTYEDWYGKNVVDDAAGEYDGDEEFPLFITWNIKPRPTSSPRLRGCIGNFDAMPLSEGLKEYAMISAFRDRRFDPISKSDLPKLECGVSLLTDFETCSTWDDWTIGEHGIYIHFQNPDTLPPKPRGGGGGGKSLSSSIANGLHRFTDGLMASPSTSSSSSTSVSGSGSSSSSSSNPSTGATTPSSNTTTTTTTPIEPIRKKLRSLPRDSSLGPHTLSATYLPDVAPAQGWDKVEAVDSAIRKAGWGGRIDEDLRKSLRVTRYRSSQCSKTYDQWIEWKQALVGERRQQELGLKN